MASYSDPGIAPRVGVYPGGAMPKAKTKNRAMPMPMKPKRKRLGLLAGMRKGG